FGIALFHDLAMAAISFPLSLWLRIGTISPDLPFLGVGFLLFGCGGDRDRAKRPIMGRIAAQASDRAWITNDNPRGEDPAAIAREILAGAAGLPAKRAAVAVELDRRAAIAAAIADARLELLSPMAHLGNVEQATAVTQLILDHLRPRERPR
ncbi:MAG TPA: cyanophycin synthetase, partial [Conexibacter sp.]|nr:cyanophycin synthetase [Conexibacter sp.]